MFWVVTLAIVVVLGWLAFGKDRLALRLRGLIRRKKDEATDNIGRGLDEHTERISAAKGDLVNFKRDIAKFTAEAKRLEVEHSKHVSEAEKWDNLAERAAESGNAEHVKKCLSQKKTHERHAANYESQMSKNTEALETLHAQAESQGERIEQHEVNTALLAAREAGNNMRQKMINSSAAFGGKDSLGDLEAYERQVQDKEFELDALEGMANKDQDLERLYGENGGAGLDDEVAALMAKNTKETV